jgi:hypothetical protein
MPTLEGPRNHPRRTHLHEQVDHTRKLFFLFSGEQSKGGSIQGINQQHWGNCPTSA